MKLKITLIILLYGVFVYAQQDISVGLSVVDDTGHYPQQDKAKPSYLDTIIWNTDESMMILYDQTNSVHQLLHGHYYHFIRNLDDIDPDDIEELFWDFDEPNILYYLDKGTDDFIRYNVITQSKEILVNLDDIVPDCTENVIDMGVGIQMMSWDSDVLGLRCHNDVAYSYRISTGELTEFAIGDVGWTAPMPARNDAYFTVAFAEGPDGGCRGNIIAHDLTTGECFDIISEDLGYNYPQSGTHISAVAHKNHHWIAASMVGSTQDGQSLLDQEIVVVKADPNDIKVCRIGHHRADAISPSGTRVLFASDWSGAEDGESVDCYVVELPVYQAPIPSNQPVYPGDCNMDGQVSADDAIYVNLALGSRLLPRPDASTDWIPQVAYDSGDSIQGVDLKYIDADGNGLIDTLDLVVITQNFDSTHTEDIAVAAGTVIADPVDFTYEAVQEGDIIMHQYTYHFESIDMASSIYGSSLRFNYSDIESVIGVEVGEISLGVNVLFVHNDTVNKDFHVVNQLIGIDEYDMKIVVCEDAASVIEELNVPNNSLDFRANDDPVLDLNKQIIVNDEGEKFQVDFLNPTSPTEIPNPFSLFPIPLNSGEPVHQFTQQLQTGKNTLHDTSVYLTKGIYFVRIIDKNNYFYTYKMIII